MTGIFRRALIATATVTLLGATLPGLAAAQVTDDNVVQLLQSAKTPADHQALADYFKAKATTAADNASKHEAMMGSTQHGSSNVWHQHCSSLVKTYRTQAADYLALAKQQEKLAKAGPH